MTGILSTIFVAAGALFAAAAALSVYRIVRGPSILDRMIASDMLLTTLILVLGAEMVYNGHNRTIPVMLVLAATAVFATIAVARYVSRQDLMVRHDSDIAPETETAQPASGETRTTGLQQGEPQRTGPQPTGPQSSEPRPKEGNG